MNWNPFKRTPTPSEAASTLSKLGAHKRRSAILSKAQRMRIEMGLPVDPRLGA